MYLPLHVTHSQTGTQKSKPKSKSTAGKHPKKKKALSEASLTQKLKPSREGAKTKAKKRKRTKKPVKEDADGSRHTGVGGVVSQGGSKVNDRTIDIERKVIERRALERQRAFEAGERVRLAEELRRLQDEKAKTGSGARFDSVREGEWEGEEGGEEEGEGEGEGAAGVRIRRECDGSNVVKLGRRKEGGERRIGTSFREEMARRKREEETWRLADTKTYSVFNSTVFNSLHSTVFNSLHSTVINSLHSTVFNSPHCTVINSLHSTVFNSLHSTAFNSLHSTVFNSLHSTVLLRKHKLCTV